MANREVSPFAPGRRAVLEWIRQDTYASFLFPAATALATASLFTAPDANNGLFTNITTPNQIASPKVMRVLGVRVHVAENAAAVDATGANYFDLVAIINALVFFWTIGPKEYLTAPLHALPSGFGAYLSATGTPAANTMLYTQQNGVPTFNNFMKFGRKVITLVPNQTFKVQFVLGAAPAPVLTNARRVYAYLVGTLGREVM
jgi:hypothetical protein